MKLIWFIVIGIGLVMLSVSLFLFIQRNHFIAQAKTAIGKVIEVHKEKERVRGRYRSRYSPTISYTTEDGKQYTFNTDYGPSYYEVGQQVEVYYQANKPSEAEIKGFLSQWMIVLGTGLTGLIISAFGGARLYSEIKKEKLQ